MLAAAASALLGLRAEVKTQFGIILVWAGAYALLFVAVERRARGLVPTPRAFGQEQ